GSYKTTLKVEDSIKMKAVIGSPNFDLMSELIKIKENELSEDIKKLEEYKLGIFSKMGELKVIESGIEQED
ncbi:MAG: argininosuccinate lyase, partial [Saccharolobus sp.]